MRLLELRIPPPIVGVVVAGAMWAVASLSPQVPTPELVRGLGAGLLGGLGFGTMIGGVLAFRRARTTVNPLRPETSSALVSGGIYSRTRNPMYLGMLFVLAGWAVYLSALWPWAGPGLFVLYITRFQILPEERALEALFGDDFAEYRRRVRRWL
jgi:protein-S-isoprenylcysteine O-methyltransferase Ste14